MPLRLVTALVVLALTTAACSESGVAPTDPTDGSPAAQQSALAALDTAHGDGTDPVTLAVTEFSLLLGPVPGALPIEPDDTLPFSGTGAVTAVAAVWDRLDEAQKAAVREHLEPWRAATANAVDLLAGADGQDRVVAMAAGATGLPLAGAPPEDVRRTLRAGADHVFDRLGGERPASLQVEQSDEPLAEGDAVTSAGLLTLAGGVIELVFGDTVSGQDCSIVLGPRVADLPEPMLRSLAAHEMFHCWSILNSPDISAHAATPPWYQEGVAAWIGEDFAGGSGYSSNWWRLWLVPSSRSVTSTSYPAIGFWSWVDTALGGDLLARIPSLHEVAVTGDDRALYGAVLQALDGDVVTGLGASRSRRADWGVAWDLDGPGITTHAVDAAPPLALPMGTTSLDTRAAELRTGTYARPGGDTVLGLTLEASGHARARWSDGTEVVAAGDDATARWCLADPCECPDGTSVVGWDALPAAAEVLTVAATGGPDRGTTTSLTVEALCEDPAPPPASVDGDSPLLGTWRSQPSSMIAELAILFEDMAGSATYAGGDVVLTFDAGGTMTVLYDDVVVMLAPEPGGPSFPMEITGGGTLSYTIDGSTMRFSGEDWTVRFRLAGVDGDLPISDEDVPSGPPSTAVWGINQGTLTLQVDTSDVFLPNQFRKR